MLPRRSTLAFLPVLLAVGCARAPGTIAWDGRRGYDGNGDYGYPLDAPVKAAAYELRARGNYPVPGPPGDPWGPYVDEAASRFAFPAAWIRAVMRQESGGRQNAADGTPITSVAGAMGLMQVMPGTYDILKRKYGLGGDPFEPRDNILAGTAYLKEMHGLFGAPGFLAAYNAGPERVRGYLAGSTILPDETVNYVASIGPRIGMAGSFGPDAGVASYAAASPATAYGGATEDPANAAFAGGGMTGLDYAAFLRR